MALPTSLELQIVTPERLLLPYQALRDPLSKQRWKKRRR